jgi:hypothetical protein
MKWEEIIKRDLGKDVEDLLSQMPQYLSADIMTKPLEERQRELRRAIRFNSGKAKEIEDEYDSKKKLFYESSIPTGKKKQKAKAKRSYNEYSTDRANKKIKEGKDKVKFVRDNIREEEERNIKRYGKEFVRRQREARQRLRDSSKKRRYD